MRSKVVPALAALAIAVLSPLGVAAAQTNDMRFHTDSRYRRITMQLERLSTQLDLSEQQRVKIKPLIEARVDQMRALRAEEGLSEEQREAKFQEIQRTYGTELRKELSSEQQKKLDVMKENKFSGETLALKRKGRIPVKDDE